jgi:hypothetical protein
MEKIGIVVDIPAYKTKHKNDIVVFQPADS